MGAGALMSEADKYLSDKKRDKKSIPVLLASILFFVWIIVGYLYNTPEKYLFLTDLIFILSVYAALTIIAIVFSFRAMFGIKVKQYNVIPKDPLNINLILLCSPVEILIVSLILFNHFFK